MIEQLSIFSQPLIEPAPELPKPVAIASQVRTFQRGDIVSPVSSGDGVSAFSRTASVVMSCDKLVYAKPVKYLRYKTMPPWPYRPEELILLAPTEDEDDD